MNTITEVKNKQTNKTAEGINRINEAEEQTSELEDRVVEIIAMEKNKEERMKWNEDSLRDLWNNVECTNSHIIGVLEEKKEKEGLKKYLKR